MTKVSAPRRDISRSRVTLAPRIPRACAMYLASRIGPFRAVETDIGAPPLGTVRRIESIAATREAQPLSDPHLDERRPAQDEDGAPPFTYSEGEPP